MTQKESIRLFEERKVRAIWDDEQEEWYFSIVDVTQVSDLDFEVEFIA